LEVLAVELPVAIYKRAAGAFKLTTDTSPPADSERSNVRTRSDL